MTCLSFDGASSTAFASLESKRNGPGETSSGLVEYKNSVIQRYDNNIHHRIRNNRKMNKAN